MSDVSVRAGSDEGVVASNGEGESKETAEGAVACRSEEGGRCDESGGEEVSACCADVAEARGGECRDKTGEEVAERMEGGVAVRDERG